MTLHVPHYSFLIKVSPDTERGAGVSGENGDIIFAPHEFRAALANYARDRQ